MAENPDFNDLFAAFNDADVRFLVVGAYAVIHYTEPRYTKDLDVWVKPTPTNAARVFTCPPFPGMCRVTMHRVTTGPPCACRCPS